MKRYTQVIASVGLLAAVAFAGSIAPTRITIKKGQTSAVVNGTVDGFSGKSYVFKYTSGHLVPIEVTSRNNCVKLGGGETSTNLATQSGDNYFDVRNDCGMSLPFKITMRFP